MGLNFTRPAKGACKLLTIICLLTFSQSTLEAQCLEWTKKSSLSFGADGVLNAGDLITFDYYLTNCGSEDLINVVIEDAQSIFTGTGPIPPVPNIPGLIVKPGITKHFITTYPITNADIQAGEVVSQGHVEYENPDGTSGSQMSDSANFYDDTGSNTDPTVQALPALADCPALACNDLINLSLDGDCEALVTVDMILEGVPDILLIGYELTILDHLGNLVPLNLVTSAHVGKTLTANIISTCDGNSCWGNIYVEDKLDPTIDCNCPPGAYVTDPDCNVSCLESDLVINGNIGQPTISDNCLGTSAVFNGYNVFPGQDCGEYLITQTWTVYLDDEYSNPQNTGISCQNEYYVYAVDLGLVDAPDDVHIECSEFGSENDFSPSNTGYPTLDGNPIINGGAETCNIIALYTDVVIPICGNSGNAHCPYAQKIIRTWQVLNWCTGESDNYTQQIVVEDTEAPTINIGSDVYVSVDPWNCGADVWLDDPQIHDNCSYDLDWYITHTNSGAILVDENGSSNTNSPKHALNVPKGDWVFTIAAVDCCGNIATAEVNVSVVDKTPPIPIAHQDLIVGLTISGTGDGSGPQDQMEAGVSKIFRENIDNGSFDMCSGVLIEIRRDNIGCGGSSHLTYSNMLPHFCDNHYVSTDHDYGREIAFCCVDVDRDGDGDGEPDGLVKVWMRVWDDANMDGMFGSYDVVNGKCIVLDNYNETWVYVRVENKLQPIISCPPDITIPCDWDYTDLSITGSNVTAVVPCNSSEFEYTDWVDIHCGQGTVERNWYIEGNPDEFCTQIITIENPDIQNPIDVTCPGNGQTVYVDCDDHDIPEPWFSGNACSLTGITSSIDTFTFEDGACYKVIKKWTIIDWCSGEEYQCEYVFARIDTEAPDIECEDITVGVNDHWDADSDGIFCELATDIFLSNSATDIGDCPSDWIKWIIQIDYWNDGTIDTEFSSFYPHNASGYVGPTQMGEDITVRLRRNLASAAWAEHTVKWKAFDGCGNIDQCTQMVTVTDLKPPTPYCIGISTALMEAGNLVELWASDFNIGSFDNCTPKDHLLYTFAGIHPVLTRLNEVHYFDENGLSSQNAYENQGYPVQLWDPITKSSATKFIGEEWCGSNQIEISVWDDKFNTDFCSVELLIDGLLCGDNGSPRADIAGYILTEEGEPVLGTTVTNASDQAFYPLEFLTDSDGAYAFENNIMYLDYSISAHKDNGHLNGVSTLDVVMIQRHILNLNPLSTGLKIVAADVNNDERVTASDLVELRKLILGIYSQLPNNDSWRFIDADQTLNSTAPWPLIEAIGLQAIDTDMMSESFTGIKIGDVNGSVIANFNSIDVENRSPNKLELEVRHLDNGQVSFIAGSNYNQVYGYQFTLASDASLVDIIPGALKVTGDNFGAYNGAITTSYSNAEAQDVAEGQVLFTLVLDQKTNMNLLSNGLVKAEAYVGSNLEIYGINMWGQQSETTFSLKQNEPNPFNDKTSIEFTIPESNMVSLSIYDLNGKIIKSLSGNYPKGTHIFQVDKRELSGTGVLYYQLESGSFTDTKKMIILE